MPAGESAAESHLSLSLRLPVAAMIGTQLSQCLTSGLLPNTDIGVWYADSDIGSDIQVDTDIGRGRGVYHDFNDNHIGVHPIS